MPCLSSLSNIAASCAGPRMGGVRAIYVGLRASNPAPYADGGLISFATFTGERIPIKGSFQSVAQVDETTEQKHFRDELAGFFVSNEESGVDALHDLSSISPDDLIILVETWQDTFYLLGYAWKDAAKTRIISAPVFFNGGQLMTGAEKSDQNGWNVTLVSVHPFPAAMSDVADFSAVTPSTD